MGRMGWVLAVVAVAACGSSLDPEVERLVGTWTWVESTGGIAGTTRTPASTGDTMSIRFDEDGGVVLTRNGETSTTTYTVIPAAGEHAATVLYAEAIFGFASQTLFFDGTTDLVLNDPCCDGFTYRWIRS